jgi:malonyl-CoA decarboxylase
LRQKEEALSPRVLRRTLEELRGHCGCAGQRDRRRPPRAGCGALVRRATPEQRRDMWLLMSEQFVADPQKSKQPRPSLPPPSVRPTKPAAEVHYRRATGVAARRLLQRFSVNPDGIRFLVDLRAEMQPHLKSDKRLYALDVEMEYMFSTWFDVGFLELRRISWDSPASLMEKLIKYEAVHDIRSWADVKNRLDSDRRCYGFFTPACPTSR